MHYIERIIFRCNAVASLLFFIIMILVENRAKRRFSQHYLYIDYKRFQVFLLSHFLVCHYFENDVFVCNKGYVSRN